MTGCKPISNKCCPTLLVWIQIWKVDEADDSLLRKHNHLQMFWPQFLMLIN